MSDDVRSQLGAHDLIAVVARGRITAIGAGWRGRLGRDPTGSEPPGLCAPGSAEDLARVLAGGTGDLEVGATWLRATGVPRPDGVLIVACDIGDLKERDRLAHRGATVMKDVAATLARLRHRLDEAHAVAHLATFELDPETRTLVWSPGMYEIAGLPPDADLSDPSALIDIVHPDDRDRIRQWFWSAPAEGELRPIEIRYVRPDGTIRYARSVVTTDRGPGGRTLIAGTVIDVTAEHDAGASLVRAREEASVAVRTHSRFLAALSHELRTPIAGVIGLIDLAITAKEPLTAERDLRSASAAARHLLGVIEDVLDYARIEAGQLLLEVRDFDLADVIAESVAVVSASARQKSLAVDAWIEPELPRWRRGDPLRVRQILVNLLGNAVKFTEKGGVALAVSRGAGADEITLRVDDTGVGIAPDRIDAVFEPFVQGEAGRRFGGSGLGLAITRDLTARMGGRIEVASTPGSGTHVTLTLRLPEGTPQAPAIAPPRRRAAATQAPPAPLPLTPLEPVAVPPDGGTDHPLRVLVADDTSLVRDVVARLLIDAGHDAVPVGDGDAAIAAALAHRFDLILMDLSMPGIDGVEAARRIRAESRARDLPRVPIVALTAWPDDQKRALEAGMDDYLIKPIDGDRLSELCASVADHELAPPIDHVGLLVRVGNQPKLAADVAGLFVAQRDQLCNGVREAMARGDAAAIARTAHGVRGALVMVAAAPAAQVASDLEAAAADPALRRALFARLEREVARAAAALSLEVSRSEATAAP